MDITLSPTAKSIVPLTLPAGGTPTDIIPFVAGGQIVIGQYIVLGGNFLYLEQFSSGSINANGPLILGIGFVPISAIAQSGPGIGLANVNGAGYPLFVQDAPFGATLTLLLNWQAARTESYTHYSINFNGINQEFPFGDYLWSPAANAFVYTLTSPVDSIYFPLRNAGQLWLNYWWGGLIETSGSGLQNLIVTFYTVDNSNPPNYLFEQEVTYQLLIDNQPPTATINGIYYYYGSVNHSVSACSIVTNTTNPPSTLFTFKITASDLDNHLLSYSLSSAWGLNQGKGVTSATYSPSHVPNPDTGKWSGVTNFWTGYWNANVANDPTSLKCAHTFYLYVWDRTINGWGYIHSASFTESLTFNL